MLKLVKNDILDLSYEIRQKIFIIYNTYTLHIDIIQTSVCSDV